MTPWDYIADISAAVGGVAALIGIIIGTRALRDSHGARLEAARDRTRQRLEQIADQLERMNTAAWVDMQQIPQRDDWRSGVLLFNRYLASTNIDLPKCRELVKVDKASDAALLITACRVEVLAQLIALRLFDFAAASPPPSLWKRYISGSSTMPLPPAPERPTPWVS